jgi:hypothetical protein
MASATEQIRTVHLRFNREMIESLGWDGFIAIEQQVREVARFAEWPDWETIPGRLEWRWADAPFSHNMIIAAFRVMPR